MSPERFLRFLSERRPPGLGLNSNADVLAVADGLEDRLNESALTSTERLRTRDLVAQCLAKGSVDRDELRSLAETLPRVLYSFRVIPDGLLSTSAVMAQAGQGLITGRALAEALARPRGSGPIPRDVGAYCPPMPPRVLGPVALCLAAGLRAFSGGLRRRR